MMADISGSSTGTVRKVEQIKCERRSLQLIEALRADEVSIDFGHNLCKLSTSDQEDHLAKRRREKRASQSRAKLRKLSKKVHRGPNADYRNELRTFLIWSKDLEPRCELKERICNLIAAIDIAEQEDGRKFDEKNIRTEADL